MEISYWQFLDQWWFASEGRSDTWDTWELEASATHQRKDLASRRAP